MQVNPNDDNEPELKILEVTVVFPIRWFPHLLENEIVATPIVESAVRFWMAPAAQNVQVNNIISAIKEVDKLPKAGGDCRQQAGSAATLRHMTIYIRERDCRLVLSSSQRAYFIPKLINDFALLNRPAISFQVPQCDDVLHS